MVPCAGGGKSTMDRLGNFTMPATNIGLTTQLANQVCTDGMGSFENQSGFTAANWRTNGHTTMSVAQGVSPPR